MPSMDSTGMFSWNVISGLCVREAAKSVKPAPVATNRHRAAELGYVVVLPWRRDTALVMTWLVGAAIDIWLGADGNQL